MSVRQNPVLVDERHLVTEHDGPAVYRVAVMSSYSRTSGSWGTHAWWEFTNTPLPTVLEWAQQLVERPRRVEIWLIRPHPEPEPSSPGDKEGFLLHAEDIW